MILPIPSPRTFVYVSGLTSPEAVTIGSQILAHRGGGLDGDDALIDLPDGKPRTSSQNSGDTRTNPDFLPRVHGFAVLVLCSE